MALIVLNTCDVMEILWVFLNAICITKDYFWIVYSGFTLTYFVASVAVFTLLGHFLFGTKSQLSDDDHIMVDENNNHNFDSDADDQDGDASNGQTAEKVTLIARPMSSVVGRTIAFLFNKNAKHYKFVFDKKEHGFNTSGAEDIVEVCLTTMTLLT